MSRYGILRGLLPLIVLLVIWQLVGDPHSSSTPAPPAWWSSLKQLEQSGTLWPALWITVRLYLEGMALAIVVGIALGIALGSSQRLTRALGPLLEFMRNTPAAAVVPVAILVFRAGITTDLGAITYGTIWPILMNVAIARSSLSPLRIDLGHSLGLSWWTRLHKIILPSLVPEIITGIRVAAPICLIVTILVDILVATGGLGYQLTLAQQSYSSGDAFAMVAVIGVLGVLISIVLGIFDRVVLRRWPRGATAS